MKHLALSLLLALTAVTLAGAVPPPPSPAAHATVGDDRDGDDKKKKPDGGTDDEEGEEELAVRGLGTRARVQSVKGGPARARAG